MNEPHFQQMQKNRVRRLQEVMNGQGFGALLLTEGPNVRYMTNLLHSDEALSR